MHVHKTTIFFPTLVSIFTLQQTEQLLNWNNKSYLCRRVQSRSRRRRRYVPALRLSCVSPAGSCCALSFLSLPGSVLRLSLSVRARSRLWQGTSAVLHESSRGRWEDGRRMICSLRAVGGEGRLGPAFFLWCHVMFGKKYKVSPQNEKLSVESARESGHHSSLRKKDCSQDFHCLSHIPHAHLSCWSRTQAHKPPLLVSIKDLPVSFIHIMSLTVSNTPPKLCPISFNLMTEWIWQPSSCSLYGMRASRQSEGYWQLCLFGYEDNIHRASTHKESGSQLNVLDGGGGARALMRRDSVRGRNAPVCGRTDLVMSKWGRLFRRHECIRVCAWVGNMCLRIWCLCVWSVW